MKNYSLRYCELKQAVGLSPSPNLTKMRITVQKVVENTEIESVTFRMQSERSTN